MTTPPRSCAGGKGSAASGRGGSVNASAAVSAKLEASLHGPRVPPLDTPPHSFLCAKSWASHGEPSNPASSSAGSFSERGRELLCQHHLNRQRRLREHRDITDAACDPFARPSSVRNTGIKTHADQAELQFRSYRDLSSFLY